jgi:hypothetical protein
MSFTKETHLDEGRPVEARDVVGPGVIAPVELDLELLHVAERVERARVEGIRQRVAGEGVRAPELELDARVPRLLARLRRDHRRQVVRVGQQGGDPDRVRTADAHDRVELAGVEGVVRLEGRHLAGRARAGVEAALWERGLVRVDPHRDARLVDAARRVRPEVGQRLGVLGQVDLERVEAEGRVGREAAHLDQERRAPGGHLCPRARCGRPDRGRG